MGLLKEQERYRRYIQEIQEVWLIYIRIGEQMFESVVVFLFVFFFNDTATTEIYTLSLHDALPISSRLMVSPFLTGLPSGGYFVVPYPMVGRFQPWPGSA